MSKIALIMGDQLSHTLAPLQEIDKKKDTVLMMEVAHEITHVPHHPKKIVFVLSAMRHFADELQKKGYHVDYLHLEHPDVLSTFSATLKKYCQKNKISEILLTEPSEYRVLEMVKRWPQEFNLEVCIYDDTRFFCGINEFKDWIKDKQQPRMEFFYRIMRKKTLFLMDGNKPVGGKWNLDASNRQAFKEGVIPPLPVFKPDAMTKDVIQLVEQYFGEHFGDIAPFYFAVTRAQALKALNLFIDERLSLFGDYQDAMCENEAFMFHSWIALYLNVGLLLPEEVCEKAEQAYYERKAPLNAVEGFIRQILGWREYIRGIYWHYMPKYETLNALNAKRNLPDIYWGAPTKMNCIANVVKMTKEQAYSHHIQRLMITGNFALLAGIAPDQVCEWYLAVYADAFDWVEMPNTLGMALFADGGIVGSKPYAASGNYINKMSNFCKNCSYKVKEKLGKSACPFNYLYWNFLITHEKILGRNMRLAFAYKNLHKMSSEQRQAIQRQAKAFIDDLQ